MIYNVFTAPYLRIHGYIPQAIEALLTDLVGMGIGGIDLSCDSDEALDWPHKAQMVACAARPCGLGLSIHAPSGDISSTDADTRTRALQEHCQALGALGPIPQQVIYVLHPESVKNVRQPGDDLQREAICHDSLAALLPLAQDVGARLALENMRHRADNPNRTGMFTDRLTEIIRGLDQETVGICFDVGHAHISEGDGLYDAFSRNAARIIHVHLADNHGVEDEHLEPGQGRIDWARFYRVAGASGFQGMLQLEVQPKTGEDPLAFYRRNVEAFAHLSASNQA